jgi:hypothetical protein
MLMFGNRAVAREGETLRNEFFRFLRQRLASGARPHFAFVMFDGPVRGAEVDADHAVSVAIDELDANLRDMSKTRIQTASQVIEVVV